MEGSSTVRVCADSSWVSLCEEESQSWVCEGVVE